MSYKKLLKQLNNKYKADIIPVITKHCASVNIALSENAVRYLKFNTAKLVKNEFTIAYRAQGSIILRYTEINKLHF